MFERNQPPFDEKCCFRLSLGEREMDEGEIPQRLSRFLAGTKEQQTKGNLRSEARELGISQQLQLAERYFNGCYK